MHVERLAELARMLRNLPELFPAYAGFHMEQWFNYDEIPNGSFQWNECGTIACAGGFASMHIPFVVEGLKDDGEGPVFDGTEPGFETYGYLALRNFFQINDEQCYWLFFSLEYSANGIVSPEQVAKRVDAVLVGAHGDYNKTFGLI